MSTSRAAVSGSWPGGGGALRASAIRPPVDVPAMRSRQSASRRGGSPSPSQLFEPLEDLRRDQSSNPAPVDREDPPSGMIRRDRRASGYRAVGQGTNLALVVPRAQGNRSLQGRVFAARPRRLRGD